MKRLLALVILFFVIVVTLFVYGCAHAEETVQLDPNRWTWTDTGLELAFAAVTVMDWSQTRYAMRNKDRFYEANPILGRYPHRDKIDIYIGASIIAHAAVAYMLPKHYTIFGFDTYPRNLWQMVWIGVEVGTVQNNARIGVRMRF